MHKRPRGRRSSDHYQPLGSTPRQETLVRGGTLHFRPVWAPWPICWKARRIGGQLEARHAVDRQEVQLSGEIRAGRWSLGLEGLSAVKTAHQSPRPPRPDLRLGMERGRLLHVRPRPLARSWGFPR